MQRLPLSLPLAAALAALVATPVLAQVPPPRLRTTVRTVPAKPRGTPAPTKPKASEARSAAQAGTPAQEGTAEAKPKKKKRGGFFGFFRRLFGGGKKKEKVAETTSPADHAQDRATGRAAALRQAEGTTPDRDTPRAAANPGSVVHPTFRPRPEKAEGDDTAVRPSFGKKENRTGSAERKTDLVPAMSSRPALSRRDADDNRPSSAVSPNRANRTERAELVPSGRAGARPKQTTETMPDLTPNRKGARAASSPSAVVPEKPSTDAPGASSILPGFAPPAAARAVPASPASEFDKARYLKVKHEAAADPGIAELGAKLNATPSGDGYKQAARAYSAALFSKMRKIDPSQTDWFNRMEAATVRRIEAGKPLIAE